jgi:hypothetical protein
MNTDREDILQIIDSVIQKHYAKKKDFNIIGIRFDNSSMDDDFDDLILFSNNKETIISAATTVPGKFWTEHPMEGLPGTAHLLPGYYEASHVLGIHGAKYPDFAHEAWIQCGKLKYAQDVNKDGVIETSEPVKEGYGAGLNIHRASKAQIAKYVDRWSAGCQVSQDAEVHESAVAMAKESMDIKEPISYLLTEASAWSEFIGSDDLREFLMK